MSDNIENYFYHNRKAYRELYFREWLPNVYLPSVKVLRKVKLNIAETQYRRGHESHAWSAEKEKNTKIQGECSEDSLSVYTGVVDILQRLDLGTIEVKIPIASGVVDLTGSEDPFANLLSFEAKQILSRHQFHITELPNQITTMLNEFASYLSCRPLLTEDDYSENAYVIHAVSKVLDPLFTYSKWHLKRKNSDLQILLKLDMKENELVLRDGTSSRAKIIRHELGKIPILGIQVIGERIFVSVLDLFEGAFYRVYRICKIIIPLRISSRQIVEELLKSALELRTVVEKIVGMSVSIKDEINLLPALEDRNPSSSSIMSTTYSPPRSS
nr:14559_t:CDS:2 [Entrophospora candida]